MKIDRRMQSLKSDRETGRLSARPGAVRHHTARLGLESLKLGGRRDGLLFIPKGYQHSNPGPMVVMLHGAGGNAHHALDPFLDWADEAGTILLAPDSRGRTWDFIESEWGPDVEFIDRALIQVFDQFAVDSRRIAIEGFSDGASYALSLGIANGDLFSEIIAFSPGFAAPPAQHGTPRIYVSHGLDDRVLPIHACSRRLVPGLSQLGYDVHYREFDGPHMVPPDVAREGLTWFLKRP